jgi:hypothetical protein
VVDRDETGPSGDRPRALRRRVALAAVVAIAAALAAVIGTAPRAGSAESLDEALEASEQTSRRTIAAQQRIDSLDDETREALAAYRAAIEEADRLEAYNEQLERLAASRAEERSRLERQLDEIEVTKRRVLPSLERMLAVPEDFVALDKPFLADERAMRLSALRDAQDRADVSVAEKLRRLLEAYQIEAEYGRTISADRASIELDGVSTTVDVLRFGRVGLYYLTLDGDRAGVFSTSEGWVPLDDGYRTSVREALAIARNEKPPELVTLPIRFGAAGE